MYDLIIANKNYSSWSLRPWILLKTLNIPFNEKLFKFGSAFDDPAFLAVSPAKMVPVLHDGDTIVWDSLAIVEYVAEQHDGVWPADAVARAWARCAAAEMHSGFSALRNTCPMNCALRVALDETAKAAVSTNLARIDALWQDGLRRLGGPFLAGSTFTAVDAFYAPVVFRLQTFGLELSAASAAYAQRILSLADMRDWYESALAETPNDPDHEVGASANGVVLKDYRLA